MTATRYEVRVPKWEYLPPESARLEGTGLEQRYLGGGHTFDEYGRAQLTVSGCRLLSPTTINDVRFILHLGTQGFNVVPIRPLAPPDYWGDMSDLNPCGYPEDYQPVITYLRESGRLTLVDRLIETLKSLSEDDDAPMFLLVSLQDLTRIIVEQGFDDTFIGPDSQGVAYAQWAIPGDGLLVLGCPGDNQIILVAQSEPADDHEALDISISGREPEVLERYSPLVPAYR